MDLFIVRHAWAEERDSKKWPDDGLRPLTNSGRKRFQRFVDKLDPREFAPAVIGTSPLVRCRQTTDILVARLPKVPRVEVVDDLAPPYEFDGVMQWTAAQPEGPVAWVAHGPDVEEMVRRLASDSPRDVDFKKGAVCRISFDKQPVEGDGKFEWLLTAKDLDC